MLPGEVKKQWKQWINQVPIIHFNNYKYDLNMMKKGLALRKGLALTKVVIPVKMYCSEEGEQLFFLTTSKFKFVDFKNCNEPELSYDVWCKSMGYI